MSRVPRTTVLSLGALVVTVSALVASSPAAPEPALSTSWADSRIATDPTKSRHQDLEQMFGDDRVDEGLKLSLERLAKDPKDPELYVHAFRFKFAWGEKYGRTDKGIDKEKLYEEMLALVEKGLLLEPGHPRLLWGFGIATARLGTTRGVLASLRSAKDIEGSWLKVVESGYRYHSIGGLEVLPCDAMVALGIFYRIVPDWWIVKLVAGTRGDIDKSIAMLERANQCRPNGVGTLKELGAAWLCKAEKDDDELARTKGEAVLTRGLALTPAFEIQRIDHRHMKRLLQHPEEACGYSRDGQQELDEDLVDTAGTVEPVGPPSGPGSGGPVRR